MLSEGGLAKCLLTPADGLWLVVQLIEEAESLFSRARRKSPFPRLGFF